MHLTTESLLGRKAINLIRGPLTSYVDLGMNFDILWFLLYKIIWDGQRPERQGGSQERGCFKERFIPIQFKRLFKARSLLIKTSSFHKFLLFLVIIRNNLIKLGPRICNDATRKFLFDYWNAKAKQEWSNVRGKNKLEQFSRTRFYYGIWKSRHFFPFI